VSDFGDFDPDDALDTEPADPEQVVRKWHRFRQDDEPDVPNWDDLSDAEKARLIARMARLIALLRRQGAMR
jgi:hypothetical protein